MAAASCLQSEDQLLCSICLDVFTDPVTIPCGHNFCNICITAHWDINFPHHCPVCNKLFHLRPVLHVNTLISEMAAQIKHGAHQETSSSPEQETVKPGEVPCDICTGPKLKALKSCLVCLTSYCETHLEPHLTKSGLKRHQLINAEENLEQRLCKKHDKLLELFCQTDQMCVCVLCPYSDHKTHDVVPMKEECEGEKAQLGKMEAEIQQMILSRQLKIEEIQQSVELSNKAADRELAEGDQVFTALKETVERSQAEFIQTIKEKQRTTEKQAEDFITELEQEITDLKKRSSEVKQLSQSEDQLQLIQSFPSVNIAPPTKDWEEVSISPCSYDGTVVRAVNQVKEKLNEQMTKLRTDAELQRVRRYAVTVTLDPDTAHPDLILSDDGKQVTHRGVTKDLPDTPERFSCCACVLGEQSFSAGQVYYEVQIKGKTAWVLGVARESINRKGQITANPQHGLWTIALRNGRQYYAPAEPTVLLCLKSRPEKVGVFVNYQEGLVSFYDADTAALIYTFTGCCFTEKLYPFFGSVVYNNVVLNSAPLIICPVNQAEPIQHH